MHKKVFLISVLFLSELAAPTMTSASLYPPIFLDPKEAEQFLCTICLDIFDKATQVGCDCIACILHIPCIILFHAMILTTGWSVRTRSVTLYPCTLLNAVKMSYR